MEYRKVQSVAKSIHTKSPKLSQKIRATMRTISDIVGATLGPGGMPVLIERQEANLPGLVTKDGVTVMRSLGFDDPVQHSIMEAARDPAIRTVSEAGDGTTTATVLAEAFVRHVGEYVDRNPRVSPQRVMRRIETVFRSTIEPLIGQLSISASIADPRGRGILRAVAKVSANGDDELADAVIQCFDMTGDEGNVTISEQAGPSGYSVKRLEGFPVPMGYTESCGKYMVKIINDPSRSRVFVENPHILLYFGQLTTPETLFPIVSQIVQEHSISNGKFGTSVVVVATGFSESVLNWMALNCEDTQSPNIVPLLAPKNQIMNSDFYFLHDLAAATGASVVDPIGAPLDQVGLDILGRARSFEMLAYRSSFMTGPKNPEAPTEAEQDVMEELVFRVDQLKSELETAESRFAQFDLQARIAMLTGGIARLTVTGPSNGELKEKRDRAEDAVCAVRGAVKKGALPGGGWTLMRIISELSSRFPDDPVVTDIMAPALMEPVVRLLSNIGMPDDEIEQIIATIHADIKFDKKTVYDALEQKFVDALEGGILDSTPAVLEAIRNSISSATLLGILGGIVVFKRDDEMERREAAATNDFLRSAGVNPANERP